MVIIVAFGADTKEISFKAHIISYSYSVTYFHYLTYAPKATGASAPSL